MLRIKSEVYKQIIEHARQDAPIEACGYLGGIDDLAVIMFPMKNAADAFTGSLPGENIAWLVMGFFWALWKFMDGLRDLLQPKMASGDLGFHGEEI